MRPGNRSILFRLGGSHKCGGSKMRRLSFAVSLAAIAGGLGAAPVLAQTVVRGRVTSEAGTPVATAIVRIAALSIGATADADGRYTFTVPAARATGQTVSITARRIGFTPRSTPVSLSGSTVTVDFVLATAPMEL